MMLKNELGVLEIVHLGFLFAFLAHLEAKICDLGVSGALVGVFGTPKVKLGHILTRYELIMVINELGVLEIVYFGFLFAFLAHLEAKICDFSILGGPGPLGGPKRGLGGS